MRVDVMRRCNGSYLSPAERSAPKAPGEGDGAFQATSTSLRASQTSAEAKLGSRYATAGSARWKFRRQHTLEGYVVDFAIIWMEIDRRSRWGNAFHGIRDHARRTPDASCWKQPAFLVLRFSNVDVYENLDGVLEAIDRTLHPS